MKRSPDVKHKSSLPKRRLAALALASLLLAGCASSGTGMQEDAGKTETAARVEPFTQVAEGGWPVDEAAAEVEPSVVQVNVEAVRTTPFGSQEGRGLGSGVIYREDGYIITNNHVVEQADEVNVAFADGSIEEGEVVGTDPSTDLAVIKVDPNGPADEAGVERGSVIIAVGSEEVETTGDLLSALRDYRPGDSVELTMVDAGEERQVTVELGERG